MKRIICVLLLLTLTVPVLLISASAAEEYVFEWVNPEAVTLENVIELPADTVDDVFVYDGIVPEGMYTVFFTDDSESVLFHSESFSVSFFYDEQDELYFSQSLLSIPMISESDGSVVSYWEVLLIFALLDEQTVAFLDSSSGVFSLDGVSSMTLVPVPSMDLVVVQLSDFVTVVNHVFTIIIENPLLAVFTASGLILVCIPLWIRLKETAR